jgi:K+-sensing histidine kinase KdpD
VPTRFGRSWFGRDRVALAASVLAPFAVAAVLAPFRRHIANTDVALILVVVVVAVAANGYRLAGYLTALFAGVWYDFFFTRPFQSLTIDVRRDVETVILLLVVGAAVTELAVWGRRQQAIASREAGYVAGIQAASEAGAVGGGSPTVLIKQVSDQLVEALNLRGCRYQQGVAGVGNPPRLRRDGQVVWNRAVWDVDHKGLPPDAETELLVENGGRLHGRFLLRATPDARVSLGQRRVAVTLADQVGSALG